MIAPETMMLSAPSEARSRLPFSINGLERHLGRKDVFQLTRNAFEHSRELYPEVARFAQWRFISDGLPRERCAENVFGPRHAQQVVELRQGTLELIARPFVRERAAMNSMTNGAWKDVSADA